MKFKTIVLAAVAICLAAVTSQAQPSYTAQAGISVFTGANATATFSGTARLPNFSGVGTLTVTGTAIAGSPSGCTIALAYQQNNSGTASAAVATISFTPSTGVQTFAVVPNAPSGDNYVATYACSSTYPTAGTLSASFSPVNAYQDPCHNGNIQSVPLAIATATTTQLVALASGKKVYVCGYNATLGATTTVGLEYGTGTTCGTGTAALTGVYVSTIANVGNAGATVTATPAGNALCAVSTGTGGIQGVLSYVQVE